MRQGLGWVVGFEPTTFGATIRRSNQLNYTHHKKQERGRSGRGERIRTSDPLLPKQVRYQAAPHPDGPAPQRPGNLNPRPCDCQANRGCAFRISGASGGWRSGTRGFVSADGVVSIRSERDSRGGSRLAGSAPLGGKRSASFSQGGAVSFGGADPPICRDDRGVFDDDRTCGHSRSGFSRARLRFCPRSRLDPLRTRFARRIRGSAPLGGNVSGARDWRIRASRRETFGFVLARGVRSLLGVQILRSAATIVASSMMTVPVVIRGAASRERGFASARGVVSIRSERDSRGGSEDPRPSAGT